MKPISHGGPRKSPSDPGARKLVLYVEDEESNRKVAQLRLGRTYDLLLATNDREACEILATQGSALYAVLMDIELKGSTLSGIQLTQLLQRASARQPADSVCLCVRWSLPRRGAGEARRQQADLEAGQLHRADKRHHLLPPGPRPQRTVTTPT